MQSIALIVYYITSSQFILNNSKKTTEKKTSKTMADIARMAGVSASTASRALRNSPLISQQTIDRVKSVAKEHGYRPHLGARNFRLKKSNIIVLVLPFNYADADVLGNPYIFKIIGTIGSTLREHGYDLLLSQMDRISEQIDDRYIHSGIADGAIIIGRGDNDPQKIASLVGTGVPFVVLGPELANQTYCSVGIDNLSSASQAVKHLAKLGRKRIAIVSDNREDPLSEPYMRYQGYLKALKDLSIVFDKNLVATSTDSGKSGYSAVQQLLKAAPDFDAVFVATSDIVAISVIQALRNSGKRIPKDVAVVGFDNIDLCDFISPSLTSISQNLQDGIAQHLVEKLLDQINGKEVSSVMMSGSLVIRRSCGSALSKAR
ncbi:MAG: DNA-binding LacI/PurR family transcriptional regulator [Cellvibrionaceae bacterium]|jgi:DNA-binding LacI/PurR family transcriptional regulator